jgi:hypothetical protein
VDPVGCLICGCVASSNLNLSSCLGLGTRVSGLAVIAQHRRGYESRPAATLGDHRTALDFAALQRDWGPPCPQHL